MPPIPDSTALGTPDHAPRYRAATMQCAKCGVTMTIQPSDEADEYTLFSTPAAEDIDWGRVSIEDFLVCPFCLHNRGGHYPLTRVVTDAERSAVAVCREAVLRHIETPEPTELMPDGDDQDPAVLAWEEAYDAYDRAYEAYQAALDRLGAFVPRTVVNELADSWVLRHRMQR